MTERLANLTQTEGMWRTGWCPKFTFQLGRVPALSHPRPQQHCLSNNELGAEGHLGSIKAPRGHNQFQGAFRVNSVLFPLPFRLINHLDEVHHKRPCPALDDL